MKLTKTLAVPAMVMFLACAAHAATVSFTGSNTPPTSLGAVVISNGIPPYQTPAHGQDFGAGSNVGEKSTDNGSDGTYAYIGDDKAVVGQSFLTGTNPAGYKVIAVSFQAVTYGGNAASSSGTFAWVPSVNYVVRITQPASTNDNASSLTVLATETAEQGVDWSGCPTCNIPGLNDGSGKGAGSGKWITFTLATPVALLPNTLYGFDVGIGSNIYSNTASRHSFYWETYGRGYTPATGFSPVDPYPNGRAYGSGPFGGGLGGHGDSTLTNLWGDRAFEVFLNVATNVTPPRFTTEVRAGGVQVTNRPLSGTYYAGATAIFRAKAAGDTNLVYQWRTNGVNISNNSKYGGVTTDTLSVSNVNPGDSGSSFTLVVTNAAGAITSAPAILTVVAAPLPGTYAYTIFTNKPIAYYRFNEFVNPATNPPTFDYMGGGVGRWETNAVRTNGPLPSPFNGFETNNYGTQSKTNGPTPNYSWSTLAPLYVNTNTVTFTAWIYPNGPPGVQGGQYSGFFFTRAGSTECGMQVGDGGTQPSGVGKLAYTWNDGEIRSWSSGYTIPANTWSFIGLVITPTNGTVYFATAGGALGSAVDTQWHDVEIWSGNWTAGFDPRYSGEYSFNGIVDELAVWNRSLSLNEITNIYAAAYTSSSGSPPLVITCSTNKTVQCGSAWSFDTPSASGGCGTATNITVTGTITNGVCPQVITRTWQATDGCSGSASCSQIVTVVDTTPPIITCATNKTVQCGSAWSFDAPSASDVCAGTNVTVIVTGTTTNGSACSLTITRSWQATDGCSNSAPCSQIVTVVDTTPPVITCATNKTVQCGSAWTFDAPSASDACAGTNVTVTVTSTTTNATGCTQVITRTWQATDSCTNSDICSQAVTVVSPDCAAVQIADVSYAGTTLAMSFQSLSCVVYDCQYKDDLIGVSSWATFQTVTGTGSSITVQDTMATSGQRFYRVVCRCH
jgi:hypothetical protein